MVVTAIIPREDKNEPMPVLAGQFTLNGNGEMTGTHWINDAGYFLGPICITNTHSVGMVHHGTTKWIQLFRFIEISLDLFQKSHTPVT